MANKIRILIADDHQIVRMGLATIIRREKDLLLAGEARNGVEAVRLARELKPDVILMDLMMPKEDGATATAEILRENPEANILVLTTFGEADEVRKALDAGALGALIKDTPHAKLVSALRDIASRKRVISPEIAHNLREARPPVELSERQIEILRYVAKGLTTNDIGRLLKIGPDGVNAHLRTAFASLNVATRSEAVAIAIQNGYLKI